MHACGLVFCFRLCVSCDPLPYTYFKRMGEPRWTVVTFPEAQARRPVVEKPRCEHTAKTPDADTASKYAERDEIDELYRNPRQPGSRDSKSFPAEGFDYGGF